MKQDIEIAQEVKIKPITEIARKLGIPPDELDLYGKYKAKIPLRFIDEGKIKKANSFLLRQSLQLRQVKVKPRHRSDWHRP